MTNIAFNGTQCLNQLPDQRYRNLKIDAIGQFIIFIFSTNNKIAEINLSTLKSKTMKNSFLIIEIKFL